MIKRATRHPIGLALGGGGARGFAHVLALEALDELGVKPTMIAGSSIGAMMGAGYAAGMSGRDIHEYILETFRRPTEVLGRVWRLRPRIVKELFGAASVTVGQFDALKVIEDFLPDDLPRDFADLKIPLKVVTTDFYGWEQTVIAQGDLRQAIAGSIAIPVLFRPVLIEGRAMVDGGIFNPLPFDLVSGHGRVVIAVDVLGGPVGGRRHLPGPTEAVFGTTQLMMRAVMNQKLNGPHAPEILVRPAIDNFRMLDFLKVAQILKQAEPIKDELKRKLEKALARVEA